MIEFWIHYKQFMIPFGIGLFLTIAGIYRNYKIDVIRRDGIQTAAEIVDYVNQLNYSSDTIRRYYYPIIRFTDYNGTGRQIVDYTFGSSVKPNKKLPYSLHIYYKENEGAFEIITESKINDVVAMVIAIIGLILVIFSAYSFLTK